MPSPGGEISPSDIFGVLGIAAIVKDLVGDSFAVGNDSSFSGIKTDPALLLSKYRLQDVKGIILLIGPVLRRIIHLDAV